MDSKRLYKFEQNFLVGTLTGVFVATERDVQALLLDQNIVFGEVLGKHSAIDVDIDDSNLTMVSDAPADIETFERLFDGSVGCNPFHYIDEDE